jgi:ABC-2 type transport system permease protein
MSGAKLIIKSKVSTFQNQLFLSFTQAKAKLLFVTIITLGLLSGFFFLFHQTFRYLNYFLSGGMLIKQLASFYFLFLGIMVFFSHLVVGVANFYTSSEVSFLFSLPLSSREIAWAKLIETAFLSSWVPLALILPFILAYGMVLKAPFYFYPLSLSLFILFLFIITIFANLILFTLVRLFSSIEMTLGAVFGMFLIPLIGFLIKFKGIGVKEALPFWEFIQKLTHQLAFSNIIFLPNYWYTQAITFLGKGLVKESLVYSNVLFSHTLFLGYIFGILGKKIYTEGFLRVQGVKKQKAFPKVFNLSSVSIPGLPMWLKGILGKDFKLLFREVSYLAQVLIFFGILAIYSINLRRLPQEILGPTWKGVIVWLNTGAIGLIVSMLNVRYTFPAFSQEGQKVWSYGFSFLSIEKLLQEKFWLNFFLNLIPSLGLAFLLKFSLTLSFPLFLLSLGTLFLLNLSLTTLSVTLGVVYPNFKEETPSKIVSGLGGTIACLFTLLIVGANLIALGLGIWPFFSASSPLHRIILAGIGIVIINLLTVFLSHQVIKRALKKLEF